MVLEFKQFCCGCRLRTGSFITGVLFAVFSLATLITCTIHANFWRECVERRGDCTDGNGWKFPPTGHTTSSAVFFIMYALISASRLLFSIILIFGISAEKPRILKWWVVVEIINVVLTGITNASQIIVKFNSGSITSGFLYWISHVVLMCILLYFILVVKSLHKELVSQQAPNVV